MDHGPLTKPATCPGHTRLDAQVAIDLRRIERDLARVLVLAALRSGPKSAREISALYGRGVRPLVCYCTTCEREYATDPYPMTVLGSDKAARVLRWHEARGTVRRLVLEGHRPMLWALTEGAGDGQH